jgi:uroporphyrin-3 C-methyltransferase
VIERDLERLRVAPHVDVAGLAVKIDSLVGAVDTLPLAMQQRPARQPAAARESEDAGAIVRLAREMWQDLRSLVRIQTVDKPEVPLIDPTHAFFLRCSATRKRTTRICKLLANGWNAFSTRVILILRAL